MLIGWFSISSGERANDTTQTNETNERKKNATQLIQVTLSDWNTWVYYIGWVADTFSWLLCVHTLKIQSTLQHEMRTHEIVEDKTMAIERAVPLPLRATGVCARVCVRMCERVLVPSTTGSSKNAGRFEVRCKCQSSARVLSNHTNTHTHGRQHNHTIFVILRTFAPCARRQ